MELLRALGALAEPPLPELEPVAATLGLPSLPPVGEHTEIFVFQLVPYASIYLGGEGRIGGDARDRIAGFWRALGLSPPSEPDHLTVLLASYAELVEAAREADTAEARAAFDHRRAVFLDEHLLSWLPVWVLKLRLFAPPFYAAWGELLLDTLLDGGRAERLDPSGGLHFRLTEGFPEGDVSAEEVLDALLAPIRSGLVLTRRDLSSAARELGIAARIGERRFMLESLLRQEARGIADWLVRHSERTLSEYAADAPRSGPWISPWRRRLEATRDRLAESL